MIFAVALAFLSALTFAASGTMLRRGVIKGTVTQAMAITVPLGAIIGWLWLLAAESLWSLQVSNDLLLYASLAGIIHFVAGRYCHYKAIQAMGTNLVAPVQQTSVVITLVLAIVILGEMPTLLQTVGIVVVLASPLLLVRNPTSTKPSPDGFLPDLKVGYIFSSLSAVAFGVSPILIGFGLRGSEGVANGLTAATIAYTAATIVVLAILTLSRSAIAWSSTDKASLGWYALSGLAVAGSQFLVYMALAIAPVSVVVPIQRTSIIMRFGLAGAFNRDAEVFGTKMLLATILSLCGAVAIAVDPAQVVGLLQWLLGKI